mmetsp:Transcript_83181/g.156532  ORF Transcript_83181/g.156532 Transcript_83181/m.156532 type:complete len:276 (+) Transcript_83181:428-1255(+)
MLLKPCFNSCASTAWSRFVSSSFKMFSILFRRLRFSDLCFSCISLSSFLDSAITLSTIIAIMTFISPNAISMAYTAKSNTKTGCLAANGRTTSTHSPPIAMLNSVSMELFMSPKQRKGLKLAITSCSSMTSSSVEYPGYKCTCPRPMYSVQKIAHTYMTKMSSKNTQIVVCNALKTPESTSKNCFTLRSSLTILPNLASLKIRKTDMDCKSTVSPGTNAKIQQSRTPKIVRTASSQFALSWKYSNFSTLTFITISTKKTAVKKFSETSHKDVNSG